jgi:hypothetical protein
MKTAMLSVIAALGIGGTLAPQAMASDWQDIKDPATLRALYSNKTFKGKDWKDRSVVAYYRDDGHGLMLYLGTRIPTRWSVKGSDQVCVVWSAHNKCYRVQRHKAKAGAFVLTDVNTDVRAVYSVEDGIPNF